jgi:hypothetical protein
VSPDDRPIPLLGSVSLSYVQRIEHSLDGVFSSARVAGLEGEVQQRSGRPSHRIAISGVLFGDGAADDLAALQKAAAAGDELSFAADITTALDLQKVVIHSLSAVEVAAEPSRFDYRLALVESPPLPPPAQVSTFGGLEEFGVGDLGFDTDVLGDLESLAGEVAGAVDGALDAIDQLKSLASLDGLSLGGFLEPMNQTVGSVGQIGTGFGEGARTAARKLTG